MADRNLSLAVRLQADATRFVNGLGGASKGIRRFGQGIKNEFAALKGAATSLQGQLAALGVGAGTLATLVQSAKMDKGLTQIGQTAGMSKNEVSMLRKELFGMARETGQPVDDLQNGFNNAVQAGLSFSEALPVLDAVNKAMAVTGADAGRLTSGLTVAATAFDFDLSKPGMALSLLDKMTVAGRLGNAELENLSDIFGRVGVNAASAGMSFDKTLGFIEALSQVEKNPERLATLTDSTLRLFTNLRYSKEAAKATGVRFFDAKGARRDAVEVLQDIRKQYSKLNDEQSRALFVQSAFGHADLDTIKGLRTLLGGDMLSMVDKFSKETREAGGTLKKDLPDAVKNAVDQTGRLKAALREAGDSFARPINDAIARGIKYGLDKKAEGGLELSGGEIMAGGVAAAGAAYLASRFGPKIMGGLLKNFGSTAAGVAEGAALEKTLGVPSVFVVNMPAAFGSPADMIPPGGPKGGPRGGGWWQGAKNLAQPVAAFLAQRVAPTVAMAAPPVAIGAGIGAAAYGVKKASDSAAASRHEKLMAGPYWKEEFYKRNPGSILGSDRDIEKLIKGSHQKGTLDITLHVNSEGKAAVTATKTGGDLAAFGARTDRINVKNGQTMVQP
jgi:TP901 family phage tail tape measure protein